MSPYFLLCSVFFMVHRGRPYLLCPIEQPRRVRASISEQRKAATVACEKSYLLMVGYTLFQGCHETPTTASSCLGQRRHSNDPTCLNNYVRVRTGGDRRNLREACLRTLRILLFLSIYCQSNTTNYHTSVFGITSCGARIDGQMGVYNWIKGYDFILKARNDISNFCTCIESI
jgi:hypothetical protein